MESITFIRKTPSLIQRCQEVQMASSMGWQDEKQQQKRETQDEVTRMFQSLQNPTLLSAFKLRDAALNAGLFVDQKVLSWLYTGERMYRQ